MGQDRNNASMCSAAWQVRRWGCLTIVQYMVYTFLPIFLESRECGAHGGEGINNILGAAIEALY